MSLILAYTYISRKESSYCTKRKSSCNEREKKVCMILDIIYMYFITFAFHSIAAQKAILFANSLNPLANALSIGVFPTRKNMCVF